MIIFLLFLTTSVWAQITDASFFPSMKSINPGVVHMRQGGFVAGNWGKKSSEKNHDVPLGGIVGGINTDINLTKTTFFGATTARFVSAEVLLDRETGTRKEAINSTTNGNRTSEDEASSNYYGAMLDFRFFGVSYSHANYDFTNKFRVGQTPTLTAHDEKTELGYTNLKIGSAIKIRAIRVGAYFLNQNAKGDLAYTFYDPNTGNQGSTETSSVTTKANGFGAGIGFTLPKLRTEVSYESLSSSKVDVDSTYPGSFKKDEASSRLSLVSEAKIWFFSVGVRLRSIQGNYKDLEDIISSNLLYQNATASDRRTETTFNFSLGDSKGFSPSAFYTQSELTTKENSPVFDNGLKYKAVTKSKAYGVTLSYRF